MRVWAGILVALGLCGPLAAGPAPVIERAEYARPTLAYDHGILGDRIEWTALNLHMSRGFMRTVVLPRRHVFEDVAPRLADVDGDGAPEVITVETDFDLGARLAIYDEDGLVAATPHIGRTHRWLAPVGAGAADLDGDGAVEIAYIDRPHLAKTLRIWRYDRGELTLVAEASGLTNHRIGDAQIAGGMRHCNGGAEMITLSADWSRIMASRLVAGKIISRDIGPHSGAQALRRALKCR